MVVIDERHKVIYLAIVHFEFIKLLRHFLDILVVDATYKTNQHSLPVIQFIGFNCLQMNFLVFFVFISEENKEAYTWAINAVKKLLDNNDILHLRTVVADRDSALINAIKKVCAIILTLMPI